MESPIIGNSVLGTSGMGAVSDNPVFRERALTAASLVYKRCMRQYVIVLMFWISIARMAHAMEGPCGLTTMVETTVPTYLPLARAANVTGVVIMMAEIGTDGAIENLSVLRGPVMLQSGALDFVKGWKANRYAGPRTCPLVVSYVLGDGHQTTGQWSDVQHYVVVGAEPPCLCDPPGVLGHKRKRFLFF